VNALQVTGVRLLLLAALIVISWGALGDGAAMDGHSDKLVHVLAFLGLAGLIDFAFPRSAFDWRKIALLLLYGIALELAQAHTPERVASVFDLLANAAGIALYPALIPVLRHLPLIRARWSADAP